MKLHLYCTPEADFFDVIGTKVLSVFLLAVHIRLYNGFYSLPPLSKSGLNLVCNVDIVYRQNLKSVNSQDYAQKPQQNCMFIYSTSDPDITRFLIEYKLNTIMIRRRYSTVQCSAVQCRAVQCIAVHAVQCIAVHAVQCTTVQYSTVQYSTV